MFVKVILQMPYIMAVCLICLAAGQCKDFEDCRSLYTSKVCIQFVPKDKKNKKPLYFASVAVNGQSIALTGTDKQSKFDAYASKLFIPLNPAANFTTIEFTRSGLSMGKDTVTIFYQRYPSMLSPFCGAQQEYVLDSVRNTFGDNTIIRKVLKEKTGIGLDQGDVQIFY